MQSSLTSIPRKRRLSTSPASDSVSIRDVRSKLAPSSFSPTLFNNHADFLLQALIETDKGSPLYQRSAEDLGRDCERAVDSLSFSQLSDFVRSKNGDEEKVAEIIDILEPALGGKIATVLSESTFRPQTIIRMIRDLMIVGEAKYGQDFTRKLHGRELAATDRQANGALDGEPPPKLSINSRLFQTERGLQPLTETRRPSVASAIDPSSESTRSSSRSDRAPHPSKTVFIKMSQRTYTTVEKQVFAILIACKAQLGQSCGAKSCQPLRGGFVVEFDNSEHVRQAIGRTIHVYDDAVKLDYYIERGERVEYARGYNHYSPLEGSERRMSSKTGSEEPHADDEHMVASLHSRTSICTVPVSISAVVEQNAIRAIVKWLPAPDLNFSLQRQAHTKNSEKVWILCFDKEPPLDRPCFKVEISQGKLKAPFVATFDRIERSGRCPVCRQDHEASKCFFLVPCKADGSCHSTQYLPRVPE